MTHLTELKKYVNSAMQDPTEFTVKMTFGEVFLFHVLLQEYSLPVVGDERFIPLMERNKTRLDNVGKQI